MKNKYTGGKFSVQVSVITYPDSPSVNQLKEGLITIGELQFALMKNQQRIIKSIESTYRNLSPDDQLTNSFFYQSLIKQIKTEK